MSYVYQRSYRGPLQGVLLDWAGTTMDYGCMAPAVVFMQVYSRKGVNITMEHAREPMGAHKKVHIRAISKIPAVAKMWQEVHKRPCSEDDVEAMFQDFVPLQLACLAQYADLIPGTLEAVAEFRRMGLKIGSTTGYTKEMMAILQAEATRRGYTPDSTVCATDVPAARPYPWMCIQNAVNLQIFPMHAFVKIGDTLPDIEEGLNAGMWTIGLAKTGNEIGLPEADLKKLPPEDYKAKLDRAYKRMYQTGAHYVVDSLADCPKLLPVINARLQRGEQP
jgi:phosphonoacetaldehyde hydrolase